MKKIVVGYDASPAAERALERAAELSKAFDSKVVVTSVAQALHAWGRGLSGVDPVDPPELHEAELERAASHLEKMGVQATTVARIGDPGKAIVTVADEQACDLIVVGSRDLNPISRFVTGSVSDEVRHNAHCDVLVVR